MEKRCRGDGIRKGRGDAEENKGVAYCKPKDLNTVATEIKLHRTGNIVEAMETSDLSLPTVLYILKRFFYVYCVYQMNEL